MTDEESNCGNCRFWLASEDSRHDGLGQCRINPPVVVEAFLSKNSGLDYATRFPVTGKDCWCGEFIHKNRST